MALDEDLALAVLMYTYPMIKYKSESTAPLRETYLRRESSEQDEVYQCWIPHCSALLIKMTNFRDDISHYSALRCYYCYGYDAVITKA